MLAFFGVKATVIYSLLTFTFAVIMGLFLDKAGFQNQVKNVSVKGGHEDSVTWEKLQGSFWQKQWQAIQIAISDSFGLFKNVFVFLVLGAVIGAFIHNFIPMNLLAHFAGTDNLWAVPFASLVGITMYIRMETMIPVAGVLMSRGVASGVMIALIIGGADASIPEVSLLSSIFKRKMIAVFLLSIFFVATITGYVFNFLV